MSRRRSIPGFINGLRPLSKGIVGLGVLTTAYLTVVKLTQARCPALPKLSVLASDYATIWGQPLSLVCLAYEVW